MVVALIIIENEKYAVVAEASPMSVLLQERSNEAETEAEC